MVSKILENLYLGDLNDAQKFDGIVICVMQDLVGALEPMSAYWIPVIRTRGGVIDYDKLIDDQDLEVEALPHQLDLVADIIHNNTIRQTGKDVLVHCMAGIERSPLAIVWYLHTKLGTPWDEAYRFVQDKRPEVANRMPWLKLSYEDRMS